MDIKEHNNLIDTSLGKIPPSIFFDNVNIFNVDTGTIEKNNIFISGKRIAYIGSKYPLISDTTNIIKLNDNQILVPGYIEPHAHPNQIYNPYTYGKYLTSKGTTVSINDNLTLFTNLNESNVQEFISFLDSTKEHTWLWSAYFEGNTEYYCNYLDSWANNHFVVQGGELTYWSPLKYRDQNLYTKLFKLRQVLNKRIEGHLPGASIDTLNVLGAAGITADHESMNINDLIKRLSLGYYVALRFSSIRPDLPKIIRELKNYPNINLSKLMFTNDGASANFLKNSTHSQMIKIALENGLKPEEAYRMATINAAVYYRLDHLFGNIAPGRVANINVIESLSDPEPTSVMMDGEWKVRDSKMVISTDKSEIVERYFAREKKDIILKSMDTTINIGIQLMNDVITRKYHFDIESDLEDDECFITYINRNDSSFINTRIKGFSTSLTALVSTYSASQDYILIGKNKEEMIKLLHEMFKEDEGILAVFNKYEKIKLILPLCGIMSTKQIEDLDIEVETLVRKIKDSGYKFGDPTYTLLFLTAMHLPYVRFNKNGLIDIKTMKIIKE
ncbi:MAG: yerA 1 [Firmicutes bacterium]|nr:yerA 1 [Bacillota bacterium]